jgi:colanic acid/amylovoran biosynthesis protein
MKPFRDALILFRNWLEVSGPLRRRQRRPNNPSPRGTSPRRYLIVPPDPHAPSGSLGDVAMLCAFIGSIRGCEPEASFTLVGARPGKVNLPGFGEITVAAAWEGREGSRQFDRLIREHDALNVLGADILDGHYGASTVCRIASYCNHAVKLGVPATILGFSFNRNPRRPCVHALSRLDPAVRVNVRDPQSLARFLQRVGSRADLCADVAFLLPASPQGEARIDSWIAHVRHLGRLVVGVNINAHAFSAVIEEIGAHALVAAIAGQLVEAARQQKLAYLLLPHDSKPQSGDIKLLGALEAEIRRQGMKELAYFESADPAEIKRVAGLLDLVVTGRMHLAIASLGAQTPVLAIAYQDKFDGLFCDHFELPSATILYPEQCLDRGLAERLAWAIAQRDDARRRIKARLPQVMALARKNLPPCNGVPVNDPGSVAGDHGPGGEGDG